MPTTTYDNLSTVTVTDNTVATYSFTGLDTATHKQFILIGMLASNGTEDALNLRVNSTTGSYQYGQIRAEGSNASAVPFGANNTSATQVQASYNAITSTANYGAVFRITINHPSLMFQGQSEFFTASAGGATAFYYNWTNFRKTGQVATSLQIVAGGTGFRVGSQLSLYGLV
jgi:hypothetical protein